MRQNTGNRMPHETRMILEEQILGIRPIGKAADFAGHGPAQAFPPGMQINYAECSELIGRPGRSNVLRL